MKKLKRILVGLLACLMVSVSMVGLFGCAAKETPSDNGNTEQPGGEEGEEELEARDIFKVQGGEITGVKTAVKGKISKVEIPSEIDGEVITSIGGYAFWNIHNITEVTIPDTVTEIGEWAFEICAGLKVVRGGDGVKKIGKNAFRDCTELTQINLSSTIETIAEEAFSGCTKLTQVTLPLSLTTVEKKAFSGCMSLTINCKQEQKPSGWHQDWTDGKATVVWGYNGN